MAHEVPNALLTFVDAEGRIWIAAAVVGPLFTKKADGQPVLPPVDIQQQKDRGFRLRSIKVIEED